MLNFIESTRTSGEYEIPRWVATVSYTDLVDSKGRTPGHMYVIYKVVGEELFRVYSSATRNGERFGGGNGGWNDFETLAEAKAELESRVARFEKATRSNKKQFSVVAG